MANYQAGSLHKIAVRNTETGRAVEQECDAAWWVNTPNWAQAYIYEGMRREVEQLDKEDAARADELLADVRYPNGKPKKDKAPRSLN